MISKITNGYYLDEERPKIKSEVCSLYLPSKEWSYSHHPHITFFKGKFYAIWSNGKGNEDDPGQRILISTSSDSIKWETPYPLIDSMDGIYSELVLTAGGFHVHDDTMVVYYGQYEYDPDSIAYGTYLHHINTKTFAIITTDGVNWSQPIDLGFSMLPNHSPKRTKTGRLILSGHITFPYTDDPYGVTGWMVRGMDENIVASNYDDSLYSSLNTKANRFHSLCESSFYQTDDDVIHMMLRSETDWLWVTESSDDGQTWISPLKTKFTDNKTKFKFDRLPDGRFYYVGCPDVDPDFCRLPLVLSLSTDGVKFDKHYILRDEPQVKKYLGRFKIGVYGYPDTLVHDGFLYVIYSLYKEGVEVTRVKLADIG